MITLWFITTLLFGLAFAMLGITGLVDIIKDYISIKNDIAKADDKAE